MLFGIPGDIKSSAPLIQVWSKEIQILFLVCHYNVSSPTKMYNTFKYINTSNFNGNYVVYNFINIIIIVNIILPSIV